RRPALRPTPARPRFPRDHGVGRGIRGRLRAGGPPGRLLGDRSLRDVRSVFAGAAQFAAVGFVRAGMPWPAIFLLTALLNARRLLYSAALRPWLVEVPALKRAVMAHFLTDEGFALSVAHFQRLGFADLRGYWLAAIGATFIPWNVATLIGVIGASAIPDPARLGLDVVFPAAMAGLVVALVTGRREIVAVVAGCVVAVVVGLLIDTRVAVLAGGLIGPFVGLALPGVILGEQPDNP